MNSPAGAAHKARIAAYEHASFSARSHAIAAARQSASPFPDLPAASIPTPNPTPRTPRPAPPRPTAPRLHPRSAPRPRRSRLPLADEMEDELDLAEDLEFAHAIWHAEAVTARKGQASEAQAYALDPDRDLAFMEEQDVQEDPPSDALMVESEDEFPPDPDEWRAFHLLAQPQGQGQGQDQVQGHTGLSSSAPANLGWDTEMVAEYPQPGAMVLD